MSVVCFQSEEPSWGPNACPCVQGIQGSSLFPVNVARKITLLGKNFHLYQVVSSMPSSSRNCINAGHCGQPGHWTAKNLCKIQV